jgi:ATP-dependent protease Clp ATPase subunit
LKKDFMAKSGDICTFCGKSRKDANLLITGISGAICDDCAKQAYEIVTEESRTAGKSTFGLSQKDLPKPQDIKAFLDQIYNRSAGRQKILSRFRLQSLQTIASEGDFG